MRALTTPPKTRILVADDHPVVLNGLRRLLDAHDDFEVVAEASDGVEAVEQTLLSDIDLAILDVSMPRKTGLQAARDIAAAPARRPCAHALDARRRAVRLRGADGRRRPLRPQNGDRPRPHHRVSRSDSRRAVPLPRAIRALIREHLARPHGGDSAGLDPLTARELEIVKLIAEAYNNDEIAEQLVISKKTVERHRANIVDKLGMTDRVELTRYAIRRGLIEP
jgi:DNA-binding NarL/FixJ family response regulator